MLCHCDWTPHLTSIQHNWFDWKGKYFLHQSLINMFIHQNVVFIAYRVLWAFSFGPVTAQLKLPSAGVIMQVTALRRVLRGAAQLPPTPGGECSLCSSHLGFFWKDHHVCVLEISCPSPVQTRGSDPLAGPHAAGGPAVADIRRRCGTVLSWGFTSASLLFSESNTA